MANVKISELPVQQKLGNTGATPAAARNWDFAYTWNSGGTTFIADYMDITDTASAAGSLLFQRSVGGAVKFSLDKSGNQMWGAGTVVISGTSNALFNFTCYFGSNAIGTTRALAGNGFAVASNYMYGFSSTTGANGTQDTGMTRHSAGVWQLNNATAGNVRALQGGGAAVASATALPLPTGRVFHVTGTTSVTSITSTNFQSGVVITLIFDGVLTMTDGGNLKLAGNFVTAADATLTLAFDGTNWYECSRSTN